MNWLRRKLREWLGISEHQEHISVLHESVDDLRADIISLRADIDGQAKLFSDRLTELEESYASRSLELKAKEPQVEIVPGRRLFTQRKRDFEFAHRKEAEKKS